MKEDGASSRGPHDGAESNGARSDAGSGNAAGGTESDNKAESFTRLKSDDDADDSRKPAKGSNDDETDGVKAEAHDGSKDAPNSKGSGAVLPSKADKRDKAKEDLLKEGSGGSRKGVSSKDDKEAGSREVDLDTPWSIHQNKENPA